MKVVMISTDRKLFEKGSGVQRRMTEYGTLFGTLDVVVYAKGNLGLNNLTLGENVTLYPTNSQTKAGYIGDAIRLVKNIMRSTNSDDVVVSTQDPVDTGLVGYILKISKGTRLHIQMHGDFFNPAYRQDSLANRVRYIIMLLVIKKADRFRVVSKRIKNDLLARGVAGKKIDLLPIVPDVEQIISAQPTFILKERYPEFSQVALIASRLEKVKNIEVALKAFANVLKDYPEAGLIIAGEGSQKGFLVKEVERLSIKKNVRFEGWGDDIFSYMKGADVFLNTSLHEGYCMSVAEAALCGCPVVTTDVGLVGDVLTDKDVSVCPVGGTDCIATSIKGVFQDTLQAEKRAKKAQEILVERLPRKEQFLEGYRKSFSLETA